jgi:hypothetical protein
MAQLDFFQYTVHYTVFFTCPIYMRTSVHFKSQIRMKWLTKLENFVFKIVLFSTLFRFAVKITAL